MNQTRPASTELARSIDYRPERWETAERGLSQRKSCRNRQERAEVQQQYAPGMHVVHPVWGEGMVLNSRLQDEDEIVDVYFADIGLKQLAASLARLEIKT